MLVSVNVANLYAQAATDAEVVSQTVLGASVEVQEERDEWARVLTEDRYQGWVVADHLTPLWDDADHFKTGIASLFAEVYPRPDPDSEMLTKLVVGTRVAIAHRPEVEDWVPLLLPDRRLGYVHKICLNMTHDGSVAGPDLLDEKARRAINVADLKRRVLQAVGHQAVQVGRRLIGTPYLWGGCTPFGLDCSGFVQLAYRLSGVLLLRDASLQFADRRFVRVEEDVPFEEADFAAGDLVVFRKRADGPLTHIGVAVGDGRFLHSSGDLGVHIDPCDHPKYVPMYAGAVRLSPDADLAIEAA